ncbi:MAG: hypothetical protein JRG76_00070 [Deltaproteobacteria bacterium]|nr:hypothetical protein [Deltaproteobacteria bacterium]MBW2412874.1 hypothetical protein [Deltaproteobacteria bacterium]
MSRSNPGLALALGAACALACKTPEPEAIYRPAESVLEVVTLLRLHRDDDTYRFEPARDYTGKNVYRASFDRLESLEQLYRDKFQSGYLDAEIQYAKGMALERITEYELAARHFAHVASLDNVLRDSASESGAICERLDAARGIAPPPDASPGHALEVFDERMRLLDELLEEAGTTWHRPVVREEIERADLARAEYFRARWMLEPRHSALVLQQYQVLLQNHADSKNRSRHLIALADLYSDLSRRYATEHPPVSLRFDAATFDEYAQSASRLYESVSQQDGAIEKIEAAAKLDAFLAFTLEVHEQKIPQ